VDYSNSDRPRIVGKGLLYLTYYSSEIIMDTQFEVAVNAIKFKRIVRDSKLQVVEKLLFLDLPVS
jgi:hypothetical protein